jgi:hypothetical protein
MFDASGLKRADTPGGRETMAKVKIEFTSLFSKKSHLRRQKCKLPMCVQKHVGRRQKKKMLLLLFEIYKRYESNWERDKFNIFAQHFSL